jgi:endonuclease YncB( thermonuclease family)
MAAVPATAAATVPAAAETAPIFAPRLAAAPGEARFLKADPAVTGSLLPGAFEPPAVTRAGEWREEEFQQVQALDGRTLAAPAVVIRLAGLELPQSGEVCRTLDNRLEPCAVRAATQLELMTRHRKVACRYRMEGSEAVGACRIGTSDLAERMLRTGFARRAPGTGQVALASAASATN